MFALCLVCALAMPGGQQAQPPAQESSPGPIEVPIWPGTPPDARPVVGPETTSLAKDRPVAGRPWRYVERVSRPTMTVYAPRGKNTGAAVIVFPGGGYWILAIDLEGTEVCDWLTSKGITCVLLKYRVPGLGQPRGGPYPGSPQALEDAQRTLGIVRQRAAEWHIDPKKVGVLGFSAGGHLVAATSTHFERRVYQPVDAADKESCRPDFAVAIYPGHLWVGGRASPKLNPEVPVTQRTPPTFLVHAQDDDVDDVQHSLVYFDALKKANVPAELHIYARGGHAFGLRRTSAPITHWPQLMETWLGTIGMIPQ